MAAIPLTHLGLSLLAGSLTTLSPCVFPILPLVIGGGVQTNRLAPLAMGVGMATSFALIGIVLGALGPALGIDSDSVRIFGAWLLIAFGLVMLVPQHGYETEVISFSGLRGKHLAAWLMLPLRLLKAFWQSFRIIQRVKLDVVLGMGGYLVKRLGMNKIRMIF